MRAARRLALNERYRYIHAYFNWYFCAIHRRQHTRWMCGPLNSIFNGYYCTRHGHVPLFSLSDTHYIGLKSIGAHCMVGMVGRGRFGSSVHLYEVLMANLLPLDTLLFYWVTCYLHTYTHTAYSGRFSSPPIYLPVFFRLIRVFSPHTFLPANILIVVSIRYPVNSY